MTTPAVKKIVAFSGGIDSTALALLEPGATPVFTDTVFRALERAKKRRAAGL